MKVVILAGGFGTRISEESHLRPKPMIEIGGQPVLWHIMKIYSAYGYHDFIICCGYKQHMVKEYFADYFLHTSDVTFDLARNSMEVHDNFGEPWRVTVVDTGLETMTGGRIKRVQKYIGDEPFLFTYGDGVADLDVARLVRFHESHGRLVTVTSVSVGQQKGILDVGPDGRVSAFREKSDEDAGFINGGFMVLNPGIFDYIQGDETAFEREPLERAAREGQVMAYRHRGFWQCMDTKREHERLEQLWAGGQAPWKIW